MLHADLKVTSGKQAGSLIQLPIGKFLIGREEDCQLRPNSDLVSRHHCVFTVDQYSIRLRDLGSTNGTQVNGERIRNTVVLNNGDKVSIGKLEFELVVHETAGDETTPSMSLETDTQIPAQAPVVIDAPPPSGEIPTSQTMTELKIPEAAFAGAAAPQQPAAPPTGDTQYMGMMTGQPQMGYPMGYSGQFMQPYGYPGYPGMYPQMGYPPMGGMYPQPGMMPMQGYPQQVPVQEAPVEAASGIPSGKEIPVKLPDPESTGAKEPEVKAGGGKKEPKQSDKAADIIKKYQQRKPI